MDQTSKRRKISTLFNEKTYADAVVEHQDNQFFVHRAVLCESEYFDTMFKNTGFLRKKTEDGLPIYTLPEPELSLEVVEYVLRLFYDKTTWDSKRNEDGQFFVQTGILLHALAAPVDLTPPLPSDPTPLFWITFLTEIEILQTGNCVNLMNKLWPAWDTFVKTIFTGSETVVRLPSADCAKLLCLNQFEFAKKAPPIATYCVRLFAVCDFLRTSPEALSEVVWLVPTPLLIQPNILKFFGTISHQQKHIWRCTIQNEIIYGVYTANPKISCAALGLQLDLHCELAPAKTREKVELRIKGRCVLDFQGYEICLVLTNSWSEAKYYVPIDSHNGAVASATELSPVNLDKNEDFVFVGGIHFVMRKKN